MNSTEGAHDLIILWFKC